MKVTKTSTIQYYDETCTLEVTTSPSKERDGRRKGSRVYVSLPWAPEELPYTGITQVPPYGIKGKNAANDLEWKRYNRKEVSMQMDVLKRAVQGGLIAASVMEAKHSRYAGCSMCPCSPGWVWKDGTQYYNSLSIRITVKSPKKEAQEEKKRKTFTVQKEIEAPSFSI